MPNCRFQFPKAVFLLLFSLFFSSKNAVAGKYFDFTPRVKEAYQKALSLRFSEANSLIIILKREEPDNQLTLFVEDYIDFLTVFLNESEAEFDRLEKLRDRRLADLAKGDRRSPYWLYTQASVQIHWAILRGKFGEYLTAINDVKQAYALLEENGKKHPDFVANKLPLGVMHAMVGTVPDSYRWAVKMFGGMSGTIAQGLAEVDEVLEFGRQNPDFIFAEEALVTYSFLLLHLGNESEKAWKTINQGRLKPKENPLHAFAIANLALRSGRTDEAISTLENCPTGSEFHPFHYRNFMLGMAKLYRLDIDANKPLEAWVSSFNGLYYVKEGYQKLAWYHLVNGNKSGYDFYINYCKSKGSDKIEGDKSAQREAEKGEAPDPILLRARLLFDGGYSQRAWDFLKNKGSLFSEKKKQLEFNYRLGRIAQKLGKTDEALANFQKTIDAGADEPWYFACNSALQKGLIFEDKKDWPKAREAYKKCLAISPDEYKSGLHAKAKAGLGRIKNY